MLNINDRNALFSQLMALTKNTGLWLFAVFILLGTTNSSCQTAQDNNNMGKVKKGDMAPDFELPNQDGKIVKLISYRGKKNVVLYFYPADDTQGCTAEACSFRDNYEDFASNETEVIGVSSNGKKSHQAFIAKYNLNFQLLSDTAGKLRKLYGVSSDFLGLIPGRETFVIDKKGKVVMVYNSQSNATGHVKKSLQALEKMKQ